MSLEEFIGYDQYNLEQVQSLLVHFGELMPRCFALYEGSKGALPVVKDETALAFARTFLLCQKSFLSAAANIGRRHPDDAAAITRRAIEAACLALAVKHDTSNLVRWKAQELRAQRWSDRGQGRKPQRLSPDIKYPADHRGLEELRRYAGVVSDTFVHFTPEYLEGHGWKVETEADQLSMALPFHEPDQRRSEREFVVLAAIHVRILDLLDECFDRAFSKNQDWVEKRTEIVRIGGRLNELFRNPPAYAEGEEDSTGQGSR